MDSNPYASPTTVHTPVYEPPVPDELRRGRGPVAMMFLGLFLGGAAAAISGALGSTLLAVLFIAMQDLPRAVFDHDRGRDGRPAIVAAGAVVGGFYGGILGGLLGGVLGLIAGFNCASARRTFTLSTIIASGISGGLLGALGGLLLGAMAGSHQPSSGWTVLLWSVVGMVCGALSGCAGGWGLGNLLSVICWGRRTGG